METDREILIWFHERLVHQFKEKPLYDYMHRLRAIIRATPAERVNRYGSCNGLDELLVEIEKEDKDASRNFVRRYWDKIKGTN